MNLLGTVDLIAGILIPLAGFLWLLWPMRNGGNSSSTQGWVYLGWALRCAGAIAMPLIYILIIGHGDVPSIYNDALRWQEQIGSNSTIESLKLLLPELFPSEIRGRFDYWLSGTYADFFYKRAYLLGCLLTGNSIIGVNLIFATIGFAGQLYLVRTLQQRTALPTWLPIAILLLWPSAWLWSGMATREALLSGCWFPLLALLLRLRLQGGSIKQGLGLALCCLGIVLLRVEQGIAFLPFTILPFFCSYFFRLRNQALQLHRPYLFAVTVLILLLGAGAVLRSPAADFLADRAYATRAYSAYKQQEVLAEPGDAYALPEYEPTPASVAKVLPVGILAGLTRPLPWQVVSPLTLLMLVENLLFWTGIIGLAWQGWRQWQIKRRSDASYSIFQPLVIHWPESWSWTLFGLIFIGFLTISTYFYGNLMRYRLLPMQTMGIALACLLAQPGKEAIHWGTLLGGEHSVSRWLNRYFSLTAR